MPFHFPYTPNGIEADPERGPDLSFAANARRERRPLRQRKATTARPAGKNPCPETALFSRFIWRPAGTTAFAADRGGSFGRTRHAEEQGRRRHGGAAGDRKKKPFGTDLASARGWNTKEIATEESSTEAPDLPESHYLRKEDVRRTCMVLRFANGACFGCR